ncbi:MAG: dihydropteroate synthase [Bacteroidota bacterium]
MKSKTTLNISGQILELSTPKVMGIINATPDSFYSGSRKETVSSMLIQAKKMIDEGATFLDIGGYSSRPGADDIPVEEELRRVIEPISEIKRQFPSAIISIDTFRAKVARSAVEAGAGMINDISAGQLDPRIFEVAGDLKVPYIAMHMRGTPQTMKNLTHYEDLMKEIAQYFAKTQHECAQAGIKDLIIDPGFGFAKDVQQNFELLNALDHLQILKLPILVGLSRKSMIYKTLKITADEALNGTSVLNALALLKGANILRVHDVKEAVEVIRLLEKLN